MNCPFCEMEEKGYSEGWSLSPEGWEMMLESHNKGHKEFPNDPPWESEWDPEIDPLENGTPRR